MIWVDKNKEALLEILTKLDISMDHLENYFICFVDYNGDIKMYTDGSWHTVATASLAGVLNGTD